MPRQKVHNPRRVYEFWLNHKTWPHRSIGKQFRTKANPKGITKQRVGQIIKKYRELEG
ncbi:MAG: hypothetical protein KAS32_04985 [Candidatus Peribacteraceae bacterium]|nr:hypothetical protein [Candidatus Peribacteraceae bacterium]